jgi:hypothetical protein
VKHPFWDVVKIEEKLEGIDMVQVIDVLFNKLSEQWLSRSKWSFI